MEESEEFKRLTVVLPQLAKSLDHADRLKKLRLNEATSKDRTVKSSRNRPDVGVVSELGRRASDASSGITLAELGDDPKEGDRFAKEDDGDSLCSIDSFGYEYEPYVLNTNFPRLLKLILSPGGFNFMTPRQSTKNGA